MADRRSEGGCTYQNKVFGRNGFCFFTPISDVSVIENITNCVDIFNLAFDLDKEVFDLDEDIQPKNSI